MLKYCKIKSGLLNNEVWLDNPVKNSLVTLKDSDDPERLWRIVEIFDNQIFDNQDVNEKYEVYNGKIKT